MASCCHQDRRQRNGQALRLPGRPAAAVLTLRRSLEGTAGRIHLSNPFHPGPADTYQVIAPRSEPASFPATAGEASFTAAIRHIDAVLAGDEEPRLLAIDTPLSTARGLHDLTESFTGRAGRPSSPLGAIPNARADSHHRAGG
jgi:hypothetical protein